MTQLMKLPSFEAWLLGNPSPDEVVEYMDYVDFWSEALRNGGGEYARNTRKLGTDYLKNLAKMDRG